MRPARWSAALAHLSILSLALASMPGTAHAQTELGEAREVFEISRANESGVVDTIDQGDGFGDSAAAIGDLDGDGVVDLALGAPALGRLWVLFMNTDGTVASFRRIDSPAGTSDFFGYSVAALGDLDGDGALDIAVGASRDDDTAGVGNDSGAVWIVFLNTDGTVKAQQKISALAGDPMSGTGGLPIDPGERFGSSVASLGDQDGDGLPELAVGARLDGDAALEAGAVWFLNLDSDGTVKGHAKLTNGTLGFTGTLNPFDRFGSALAPLGDLDGNGVTDLAVGAPRDTSSSMSGKVWILFMGPMGASILSHVTIGKNGEGGFGGFLGRSVLLGSALATIGDLDSNGAPELAVGSIGDDDGDGNAGAVWQLFLNVDGTVASEVKLSALEPGFPTTLPPNANFGSGLAGLGDLDSDGTPDLLIGSQNSGSGAVDVAFLANDATVDSANRIDQFSGDFGGAWDNGDFFGGGLAPAGDLDGDGVPDLFAGAPEADQGGSLWVLLMNEDGTVKALDRIDELSGTLPDVLSNIDDFATSIANLGDVDGDLVDDWAVGAPNPLAPSGSVWILFMNADRTLKGLQEISPGIGGFTGSVGGDDEFGYAIAPLGDLDGDGTPDLAAGAPGSSDSLDNAVWVLLLNADGTVKAENRIDRLDLTQNISGSTIRWGASLANLGDLDGDGVTELVLGSPRHDGFPGGGDRRGSVWILYLNSDGTLKDDLWLNGPNQGWLGLFDDDDNFGESLAPLGDLNRDGNPDIAVGAGGDSDAGNSRGAIWLVFLNQDGTIQERHKLTGVEGGATTSIATPGLGQVLATVGDLNRDGIVDLVTNGDLFTGTVWTIDLARGFSSDITEHSLATGDVQTYTLDAGATHAGLIYWILGSLAGTLPGLPTTNLGLILPINFDGPGGYFFLSALNPNGLLLGGGIGVLNGSGEAAATFTTIPCPDPQLVGVTFNHAYAVFDPFPTDVVFTSNAIPSVLVP